PVGRTGARSRREHVRGEVGPGNGLRRDLLRVGDPRVREERVDALGELARVGLFRPVHADDQPRGLICLEDASVKTLAERLRRIRSVGGGHSVPPFYFGDEATGTIPESAWIRSPQTIATL